MTKLKKRATALLLGTVTFFMALVMPYHTTEVYAVDVGFTWVVNEYSNQILQWILLYLGISVAPEAISEGKVFDKTGEFAMDFCKEFFGDSFEQWYVSNGIGDDVDTFKKAVDDVLTTDWSSVGDAVASIPSDILDTVYNYLHADSLSGVFNPLSVCDLSEFKPLVVGDSLTLSCSCGYFSDGVNNDIYNCSSVVELVSGNDVRLLNVLNSYIYKNIYGSEFGLFAISNESFTLLVNGVSYLSELTSSGIYAVSIGLGAGGFAGRPVDYFLSNVGSIAISSYGALVSLDSSIEYIYRFLKYGILDGVNLPNVDVPDIAGKDWAYDIVGWPNTWDIDKPDVKPWDGVDSLPIPGDVVLGDSIPGVIDFPDVIQKIIDGKIPWPDVIGAIRDIDIPGPDPGPDEPDKKPEPDPELPEIPAVLPQGVSDKLKDLSGKFPFCIPFDVVDCYKSFATKDNAEAPKWDIDFTIPGTNQEYHFSIDLAMFEKYIPIFRSGVLILFFIGLLLATRKLIGWQIDN